MDSPSVSRVLFNRKVVKDTQVINRSNKISYPAAVNVAKGWCPKTWTELGSLEQVNAREIHVFI
jgi:hypothetical protein